MGEDGLAVVDELQVVLDVAVRAEHERLRGHSGREPLQRLGGEAVQPGQPVRPGDAHDRAVRQVDLGGTGGEAPLLAVGVAVVRGDPGVRGVGGHGAGAVEQRAGHTRDKRRAGRRVPACETASMWDRLVVAVYSRAPERPRRALVRLATPGYRVGVLAAVFRPDGRLLLVDQPYVAGWSLPGGDLKRGEEPGQGLARELHEELGLVAEVPQLREAFLRTRDRWVTFVARVDVDDARADAVAAASAELRAVGWYSPGALPPLHGDAVGPLALLGATRRSDVRA